MALIVGIVMIHIIQYAAIEMMGSMVPVFIDILPKGGTFSAEKRVKDMRDIVVLWVPLVADAGLIAIATVRVYRKQRITAEQQVGPLR
jgi:hypothetical protein